MLDLTSAAFLFLFWGIRSFFLGVGGVGGVGGGGILFKYMDFRGPFR